VPEGPTLDPDDLAGDANAWKLTALGARTPPEGSSALQMPFLRMSSSD
jgi:hypothetical protein